MSIFRLLALLVAVCCTVYAAPLLEDEPTPVAGDPAEWRLPTHATPNHYALTLQPYFTKTGNKEAFTFDGTVEIEITVSTATRDIWLHSKNLDHSSMECYDKTTPQTKIVLTTLSHSTETDIWKLQTASQLAVGRSYILRFTYIGHMDDDMHGFYRSSYLDENNNETWLGATQFQTNHARRAFPCFDEPKFKATFAVTIIRPKNMKTVSNEEQASSTALGNGWYADAFKTTPKMSTYLLAFIVSEFNERKNTQFGVVARPEYYGQTAYAHEVGQKILKELDDYLKINYYDMGIEKMQMAAIPDFSAGAMENWGLLTYRERALLYDSATTTLKDKQYIASVVAHEQAHMWFGDYVTCDWWSYTWLNEGFARFFQYYATHNVEKDYHLDQQFTVDQVQSVMAMDSTNATNPMSDPDTNTPADLSRMFNSISYNKGATFIRMTKHILGEDNFRKSLNEYLEANKYTNTVPKDLFDQWKKYWPAAHAEHVDEYFRTFTEQVGYPVLTVNVSAFGKTSGFVISQKRFLLKDDGADKDLVYRVPFTYTTSAEKDFSDTATKAFLTKDEFKHDHGKNFSWAIANVQQAGYYRVNYDTHNWHSLHEALLKTNFDGIHELNRAQIVDDLLNLARAAIVDYETAFDVLDYLKSETHYAPWTAAFNGLNYISIRMGTDLEDFTNYILAITEKAYNTLGFEEKTNDTSLDIYNRAKVLSWACKFGHPDCISKAKEHFKTLRTVPVNIRSAVYCTGIREGNSDDFDHLWMHAQHMNVASETTIILNALGCTKDDALIKKYFDMILGNEIRKQDKSAALTSLYSENNENVNPVFKLVTENVDPLAEAMGSVSSVATVIANIAARFTTEAQHTELKAFNTKNKDKFGSSYSTLEKAETTVADNLKWTSKNGETLKKVLIAHGRSGSATLTSLSAITMVLMAVIALLLK